MSNSLDFDVDEDDIETLEPERIEPPFELSGRATMLWPQIISALEETGTLSKPDLFGLARYVEMLAEWQDLNDFRAKGEYYSREVGPKGNEYVVKHPEITRLEKVEEQLLKLEKELNISRKSRPLSRGDGAALEEDAKLMFGD